MTLLRTCHNRVFYITNTIHVNLAYPKLFQSRLKARYKSFLNRLLYNHSKYLQEYSRTYTGEDTPDLDDGLSLGLDSLDDTFMPSLNERDNDSSDDDSSDDDSTLANTEEASDSLFTPCRINKSCKVFETRIAKLLVAEGGDLIWVQFHIIQMQMISVSQTSAEIPLS